MRHSCLLIGLSLLAAAPAAAAWADEPKARVEGVEDGDLRKAIERVVGESQKPAQSRFEARRRADEAAEDVITVLRSEGYYDYQVIPDVVTTDGARRPIVRVTTGPRFTVAQPKVEWANGEPSPEAEAAALKALAMPEGVPGRAADVVAAEGRLISALESAGYADAATLPRQVIVDHADHTLRPTFRIDARTLTRMDSLRIRTRGKTDKEWVERLAPWKPGDVYEPKDVAELERRLLETGVYRSVNVSLAKEPDAQGLRPVVVGLTDRPKATIEASASYSTLEGFGVSGRYTLYNRLNRADTITLGAQYSDLLRRLDTSLTLPHWRKPDDTLRLSAQVYQDDTDAYREEDAGVRAELVHRFAKTSFRTYGLALDASNNDEKWLVNGAVVGVQRQLFTATGIAAISVDHTDNPLDPTRGWKADGRVEPTISTGDDTLYYLRAVAQGSAYWAFGKEANTVLAGRVRLGSILGGGIPDVPAARRFYAGGGGSVRGYAYQQVGPLFPAYTPPGETEPVTNTPIGGLSLLETSVEVRHKFTQKWGGVVFVDAGTVSEQQYPTFSDLSVGAGFGVRYDLGFGPIRADIAFPLNRRSGESPVAFYISIGQAF
ncbi:MAG: autotransporter assembly complex protein TamA [Caulobacteraceae bacterium]